MFRYGGRLSPHSPFYRVSSYKHLFTYTPVQCRESRQGMNSGLRDAANLAWKLSLVLKNQADVKLLTTYSAERQPHMEYVTRVAIKLGEAICCLDEDISRKIHESIRSQRTFSLS